MTTNKKPKILLWDIETAPTKAYMWGMYQELLNSEMVFDNWYMLCWGAKWLHKRKIISDALYVHKGFKKDPDNDRKIVQSLRDLLDEADIVIAHNGDKFDCRKFNARCIYHGIEQPSPYTTIDTLKVSRKYFAFGSNKLNDLCKFFKIGAKTDTGGFKLWKGCLNGEIASWKKMVKYCKHDVKLLEEIYLKLRPYMNNHPHIGIYTETTKPSCPNCGSIKIHWEGYTVTKSCKYRKYKCTECGSWGREKVNQLSKETKKSLGTNIS